MVVGWGLLRANENELIFPHHHAFDHSHNFFRVQYYPYFYLIFAYLGIKNNLVSTGLFTPIILSSEHRTRHSVGASIGTPAGIALDPTATYLYVCDSAANAVRRVELANGAVTLVAGGNTAASVNGVGAAASFNGPADLVVDHARNLLYVAEFAGRRVRRIQLATNNVTTVATLR